ncbi:MAG: hypothetical protein U0T77_10695 [Chitinophagales bacterium]
MELSKKVKKAKTDLMYWWRQWLIDTGAKLMRKGCMMYVGQRVTLPAGNGPSLTGKGTVHRSSPQTVWVENMFFNFKQNAVTYSWTDKPPRKTSVVKLEPKG